MAKPNPKIPLPKGWPASVQSGVLHVVALAQFAMTYARGWAVESVNTRVRRKAELDQANQDNALLREEMRIKSGWPNLIRTIGHTIRPPNAWQFWR
jgi:hypothetical protein